MTLGLRQGELLGLRWEDIDSDTGNLSVRQTLQRQPGEARFGAPKTERSRRTLALPAITAAALRSHRVRQVQDRLLAGSRWREHGLVFATRIGTPLDPSDVTHSFQRVLARLGLPRLRFHDARHTFASLLLADGAHPRVVMEILGHSQIGLTMNTYSHVIPALKRDAADQIDRLVGAV